MVGKKVHYVISSEIGNSFCGRYVSVTLDVTRKPAEVTCSQCLRELGNRDRFASRVYSKPAAGEGDQ